MAASEASCLMCGADDANAREWASAYSALVPGVELCAECCERAANAFSMKHGGQWLTWPNAAPAMRRKAKQRIGAALRTRVFERDRYRCVTCATHLDLTADHIVPESLGGPTEFENLQTLCRSCNARKGARVAG